MNSILLTLTLYNDKYTEHRLALANACLALKVTTWQLLQVLLFITDFTNMDVFFVKYDFGKG